MLPLAPSLQGSPARRPKSASERLPAAVATSGAVSRSRGGRCGGLRRRSTTWGRHALGLRQVTSDAGDAGDAGAMYGTSPSLQPAAVCGNLDCGGCSCAVKRSSGRAAASGIGAGLLGFQHAPSLLAPGLSGHCMQARRHELPSPWNAAGYKCGLLVHARTMSPRGRDACCVLGRPLIAPGWTRAAVRRPE